MKENQAYLHAYDDKVEALLAKMTLKEKIGQLNQGSSPRNEEQKKMQEDMMRRGEMGKIFMDTCLLDGGFLPVSFFDEAYDGGEEALWLDLHRSRYERFARAVEASDGSLSAIERCADNHWMTLVREGAKVPFGAEVAGGYLIGCETSVKNLRIILAAKDAGLSSDVLRERIRESYV
jgi:V/A-type H+-transporting ATPase subunit C